MSESLQPEDQPSEQVRDQASPPEDTPSDAVGKRTIAFAAFLMALPAAVPLLVIVEPSLVPFVGEVDTSDTGMVGFLVGMAFVLLVANWGFLYVIYRWLNNMARDEAL
jgi:uncharacterized BrkB/YihY/UPF0761 family membrane protein